MMVFPKTIAFLKLVRYPNLLFIALTQVLFYHIIQVLVFLKSNGAILPQLGVSDFLLLLFASLTIAAAGYIINDYFDMDIDNVNKPERLVIGKVISRRWAMLLHMLLSLVGLFLTALVAIHIHNILLLVFNFLSVILLLFYSTTFKKKLLIGNVIISLLTAWVVGVLFVAELKMADFGENEDYKKVIQQLYKYTLVYAGFAFVVSLIREVVKDLEDMIGDKRYGCTTIPIVWGVMAAKIYAAIWIVVLMGAIIALFFYAIFNDWVWLFPILELLLLFFVSYILLNLKKASTSKEFSKVSNQIKLLMLLGILSMLLFI